MELPDDHTHSYHSQVLLCYCLIQSELVVCVRIHGPEELAEEGLGEDLLDFHFVLFAPGHRDARVVVVGLARALGDLLVFVSLSQQF